MTLKELFKRILVNSGQFLLLQEDLETIEMKTDSFQLMVADCLEVYNGFEPLDRSFALTTTSTSYTFTGDDSVIPQFIIELIPVVISGLPWYFQNWMTWQGKGFGDEFNPLSCIWRYNRPTLTIEYVGRFSVRAAYNRPFIRFVGNWETSTSYKIQDVVIEGGVTYICMIDHTSASNNKPGAGANWTTYWNPYITTQKETPPYYDLPNVASRDRRFLKLVLGRFMQSLGRSRNTFILSDVPVTSNASELISRGEKLEEDALAEMDKEGNWWMAQA